MTEKLTDEQLWLLCLEEEKRKEFLILEMKIRLLTGNSGLMNLKELKTLNDLERHS